MLSPSPFAVISFDVVIKIGLRHTWCWWNWSLLTAGLVTRILGYGHDNDAMESEAGSLVFLSRSNALTNIFSSATRIETVRWKRSLLTLETMALLRDCQELWTCSQDFLAFSRHFIQKVTTRSEVQES
ncbi:hypothetical protein Tco_1114640 [Tanacetum coccineum]|uniref:Uncharacterized protein n=1 Tax=Tanacetum coccineum TaxID=301880 RepID=A0ABQ5IVN3_9ASTR